MFSHISVTYRRNKTVIELHGRTNGKWFRLRIKCNNKRNICYIDEAEFGIVCRTRMELKEVVIRGSEVTVYLIGDPYDASLLRQLLEEIVDDAMCSRVEPTWARDIVLHYVTPALKPRYIILEEEEE